MGGFTLVTVGGSLLGMTVLPQVARVHPETVTRHSEGEKFFSRPRLRSVNTDHKIATFKVNPTVWAMALNAANGDAHRIEIVDSMNVTVHNSRLW